MHTPEPRLLVVDDQPAIHQDFSSIFQSELDAHCELDEIERRLFGDPSDQGDQEMWFTCHIDSAYQGEQAVELVDQAHVAHSPYLAAFVDIRMPPGIDGIVTAERIWQIEPELEVVLFSAHSDYTWNDVHRRLGARANLQILRKPIEPVQVRQLVHSMSLRAQSRSERSMQLAGARATIDALSGELQGMRQIFSEMLQAVDEPVLLFRQSGELYRRNRAAEMFFDDRAVRGQRSLDVIRSLIAQRANSDFTQGASQSGTGRDEGEDIVVGLGGSDAAELHVHIFSQTLVDRDEVLTTVICHPHK